MTRFRPCIDLHSGQVKQIIGGTLRDDGTDPTENFVADHDAAWFANKYQRDGLSGGHVIKLGPGNDDQARSALNAWPNGLQIGGGITADNAASWLDAGASHVIVTSWLFDSAGRLQEDRLEQLVKEVGQKKIVLDLSCRRDTSNTETPAWTVAMNRWQTPTNVKIENSTLDYLARYADEFLVHAADVEGLCQGVDNQLVQLLGQWAGLPITYAGGAASMEDVRQVDTNGNGQVDITVGSALDLFGGSGVRYDELVQWSHRKNQ